MGEKSAKERPGPEPTGKFRQYTEEQLEKVRKRAKEGGYGARGPNRNTNDYVMVRMTVLTKELLSKAAILGGYATIRRDNLASMMLDQALTFACGLVEAEGGAEERDVLQRWQAERRALGLEEP